MKHAAAVESRLQVEITEGPGIGLVLSRQIAEAHGGSLTLENRIGHPGCCARLRLPLG